jgi:hypothetical protein
MEAQQAAERRVRQRRHGEVQAGQRAHAARRVGVRPRQARLRRLLLPSLEGRAPLSDGLRDALGVSGAARTAPRAASGEVSPRRARLS